MAAVRNGTDEKKRKIFLYSSHDINVYAVLAALKVVKPHLPHFTSAVILELLSLNGNYYVKVRLKSNFTHTKFFCSRNADEKFEQD